MSLHTIKYTYSPQAQAGTRVLGPLEGEVMEVVWRSGQATVNQVHTELRRKKSIAYTTVMTTMTRLARKGLLDQDRSRSRYLYTPSLDKAEFDRYVVCGVVGALLDDNPSIVVECLTGKLEKLDEANLEALRLAMRLAIR